MKLYKSIFLALSALAAVACAKEKVSSEARSVLTKDQLMTFAAVEAPAQTMEVYADGSWKAEVESEWIHVDPMFGSGAMNVTITVDDNNLSGVVDNPRSANIYFRGASALPGRFGVVKISQKGDTYKGKPEYTVAQLLASEPDALCKLPSVTVAAISLNGFVAADNTGAVFVKGSPEGLKQGDKVFLNGKLGTDRGLPAFILDETDVRGNEAFAYPEAKAINVAEYTAATSEFVKVEGSIVGFVKDGLLSAAAIRIPGTDVRMMMADAPAEAGWASYNYHKVVAEGYFCGMSGKTVSNLSFIVAKITDKGEDTSVIPVPSQPGTVLFFDNFDWMDPFIADYNGKNSKPIGKSVEENNSSGNAPNVYTDATLKAGGIMDEFAKQGYIDINAEKTSMYPQDTYWKFGKTNVHTGIRIPMVNYFGEVEISFDWSPHMTGSGNIDKVNPVVEVVTGDSQFISDPFENDWKKGQLGWKNVRTIINITPESEIFVRPEFLEDHDGVDQMRWYIDNIKVRVPAPDVDPVFANITCDTDLLTFEGTGGDITIKVKSDVDFKLSANVDWLTFDLYGGDADEETAIKVTCAPSDLSVLRKAEITITSGDSSKKLAVVQSAAGQDLDPLLSLNKNFAKINAKGGSLKVRVQSNVEYTAVPDVAWISVAPATKAVNVDDVELIIESYDNTEASREGHVVFSANDMQSVLTITQEPKSTEPVLFEDDFSWLSPMIAEYNEANPATPVGDFVGGAYATISDRSGANAPNAYTKEPFKSKFPAALAAAGYTDLNPTAQVIYPQDTYLKFGKTSVHTGLSFTPLKALSGSADVRLTFDWVRHIQGSGTVDPVTLKVFIDEGPGKFEATGTTESPDLTTAQVAGQDPFWTPVNLTIVGAGPDTKITIISQEGRTNLKTSGAHRYHLDNIKVTKIREQVFFDDFSWMDPIVSGYNATITDAAKKVGKTVEGQGTEAPNIWNIADLKSAFEPLFTAKGYTDLNQGEKLMYLQDGYLKFSKTGGHNTVLQLQVSSLPETPTDVEISFDYCMMVQGGGTIDEGPMGVYLIGDGQFDNGTKLSDGYTSAQEPGQYLWNHTGPIKAYGVTKDTKFVFLNQRVLKSDGTFNWAVSGAGRFFLDNISIYSK